MKPVLNPNLKEFWAAPARNRVLYGGRDSSKTWDAAGNAILLAQFTKVRFMATRQFQNRISDSVYTVLCTQIERFGMSDRFDIGATSIYCPSTGSDFLFYGRARNLSEIKGTEGVDIHWGEEMELLTQEEWMIIDATIRKEGSEHWIIFNPRLAQDFVYQRFVVNPPADTIVRLINYNENQFISQTSLKRIEAMKLEAPEDYEHYYLGVPWADDEQAVIKRSWIEACVDAHIKLGFEPMGEKRLGFDVADDGDDKCANLYSHGSVAIWGEEWNGGEDELLKSCSRTYQNAVQYGANIQYDSIGVGAGCGAKFDEINEAQGKNVQYSKFNAGAGVFEPERYYAENRLDRIKNKDYFSNLKAQTWWLVADRFRNTFDAIKNGTQYKQDELISIASTMPNLEKLKTELSTPKRDFDANGRVKVESKKDLAKREVKSPNLADAFMMCYAPAHRLMVISADALKEVQRR